MSNEELEQMSPKQLEELPLPLRQHFNARETDQLACGRVRIDDAGLGKVLLDDHRRMEDQQALERQQRGRVTVAVTDKHVWQ